MIKVESGGQNVIVLRVNPPTIIAPFLKDKGKRIKDTTGKRCHHAYDSCPL
jgi:hypothetical protein